MDQPQRSRHRESDREENPTKEFPSADQATHYLLQEVQELWKAKKSWSVCSTFEEKESFEQSNTNQVGWEAPWLQLCRQHNWCASARCILSPTSPWNCKKIWTFLLCFCPLYKPKLTLPQNTRRWMQWEQRRSAAKIFKNEGTLQKLLKRSFLLRGYLEDFPAVFFHISHWYLPWNTAGRGNWQLTNPSHKESAE